MKTISRILTIVQVLTIMMISLLVESCGSSEIDVKKEVSNLTQAQKDSVKIVDRQNSTILAPYLLKAYDQNEIKADNDFTDKTFHVEGIVEDIGRDIMGGVYITLNTGDELRQIQCFIIDKYSQDVANIVKGQSITIIGKCSGLMMNVLMNNCRIVENLEDMKKRKDLIGVEPPRDK